MSLMKPESCSASPAEEHAAAVERVNEAGLAAEECYEAIVAADRDDGIAAVRDLLMLAEWQRIAGERLRAAQRALQRLISTEER